MQAYDIMMLIVLAVTTFIGFRKGLAWQIASLAAIFFSYFVALRFRDVVASKIDAQPPWNTALAMLIVYVASSLVIWILFRFVRGFIDGAKLGGFDRQLGALLGMGKGIVLCVIITLFAVSLLGEQQRRDIIESRSGLYIARLLDQADAVMPTEMHNFLNPYLNQLENRADESSPNTNLDSEMEKMEDWLKQQGGQIRAGQNTASHPNSTTGKNPAAAAESFFSESKDAVADRARRMRVFDRR
ncbi:MAG: CvpA family protein [Pirellulaceae bacterium]|nr:CvpA family protein [Pirellulaceae bacterium]